jgi:hypothetical protein
MGTYGSGQAPAGRKFTAGLQRTFLDQCGNSAADLLVNGRVAGSVYGYQQHGHLISRQIGRFVNIDIGSSQYTNLIENQG